MTGGKLISVVGVSADRAPLGVEIVSRSESINTWKLREIVR
jgi:hypothetical protein